MVIILAVVMFLLIGGGVGGYFLFSGKGSGHTADERPADALPRVWEAPLPASESENLGRNGLRTMWADNNDVIYGDDQGVRAFDRKSGKKKWTVETPKGAGEVCAMSEAPSDDGVGAVVFDAGGNDCSFLSAVDTDTGHTLWSKNLKGRTKERTPRVVVNGKAVGAAIGNTFAGFTITGGGEAWNVTTRGHDCRTSTGLSPQYLAISSDCTDAKPARQISLHDLEHRSITSDIPDEQRSVERTLSDRPLTLLMQTGDGPDAERSIQTYTKDLKPSHSFPLNGELKDLDFQPRTTFVDENEQVLVSAYRNNGGMAATDLRTGKLLWSKRETAATALEDGKVVAVAGPVATGGGRDPRLVTLDLRSGEEKVMGTLYDPKHSLPSPMQMSLRWNGNEKTLYVQGERLSDNAPSIQAFKAPNS
ncbi:PQQ-binding-like beta-propeller repeat protein [Streptomyces sp. x-80]|uniref:outer membrane protein assembly factor BamB family protein n=1 Tax=Streptomyces sp. x-80 TaxID=2789282 RepID=UPI003981861B